MHTQREAALFINVTWDSMAICPARFSNFIQRHHQPFPTCQDSAEQRSLSPWQTAACICADFLSVCATGCMQRSEGKFSSWSSPSTLFQKGSLCSFPQAPWDSPICTSTSLQQCWDSSCSHYASGFYMNYWDLNSSCLHGKLFGPPHQPFLPHSQPLILQTSVYVTLCPELCLL